MRNAPTNTAIEALVFDMDGLLIDTERPAKYAMQDACRALGVTLEIDWFDQLIGRNMIDAAAIVSEAAGRSIDAAALEALWDAEVDKRLAAGVDLRPTVGATLEKLAARGWPMAVATSSRTARAEWKLTKAGIRDRFEAVVGFDQVANGKPAPDLFLAGAARLGRAPARCAAFEDSAPGVRAALAAGMVTTQIPDLMAPDAETRALGHHIADDLEAACAALALL